MNEHDEKIQAMCECYKCHRQYLSHEDAFAMARKLGAEHQITSAQYVEAEMLCKG